MKSDDRYAVSLCLMGENCKYSGGNNYAPKVIEFLADKKVIGICPEIAGGLSIPREPCEINEDNGTRRVITLSGKELTDSFLKGARDSLKLLCENNVKYAILKSGSPSCGYGRIYDGSFTGQSIDENGIAAELFMQNGIEIFTEEDFK